MSEKSDSSQPFQGTQIAGTLLRMGLGYGLDLIWLAFIGLREVIAPQISRVGARSLEQNVQKHHGFLGAEGSKGGR